MAEKIKKSEITYLAKRICKINEQLLYACILAEELVHNETLRDILLEKDEAIMSELQEKVLKYSEFEDPVNVTACECYLEEATEILASVFYNE